jgi:hypothetical protein
MDYGGSLFDSVDHSARSTRSVSVGSPVLFSKLLQQSAQRTVAAKDACALICASWCDDHRVAPLRSSGVWLDHDGGEGVTACAKLPMLLKGLAYVAVATYSHTPSLPKYRVWLPLDRYVTPDEYKAVWSVVYALVGGRKAGFDQTPSSATSLFYLPCRPKAGDGFFTPGSGAALPVDAYLDRYRRLRAVQDRLAAERALCHPAPKATPQQVEDALRCIDPNDREVWFRVACALAHEFGEAGRPLWDWWAQASPKYDRHDQEKTWRSIRGRQSKRPITIATIFWLAK